MASPILVTPSPNSGFDAIRPINVGSADVGSVGSTPSPTDYSFSEYLEGLLSSVGAESEINRLYNSAEAQKQREWASHESELNRQWQAEMSSSAYTRAVADLKNAGLNPVLAATGMASSPTGVIASGSSASSNNAGGGDTLSSLLNSIANVAESVSEFLPNISKVFRFETKK